MNTRLQEVTGMVLILSLSPATMKDGKSNQIHQKNLNLKLFRHKVRTITFSLKKYKTLSKAKETSRSLTTCSGQWIKSEDKMMFFVQTTIKSLSTFHIKEPRVGGGGGGAPGALCRGMSSLLRGRLSPHGPPLFDQAWPPSGL